MRTSFLHLDIVLILCVLGLMSLGIAFIYSSGVTSEGVQVSNEWIRQIIWSGTGLGLMAVFASIDYRRWRQFAVPFFIAVLLLLITVLMVGSYVKGARAWLGIGRVGIQPSEFAKLSLILVLARWFDERGRGLSEIQIWIIALLITAVPVALVLIQPDLGTAIVFIPILFAIAFLAGISWRLLFFLLMAGSLIIIGILGYAWAEHIAKVPVRFLRLFTEPSFVRIIFLSVILLSGLMLLGWFIFHRSSFLHLLYFFGIFITAYGGITGATRILRDYQMMRLVIFLDPQVDPRGAGWHIIQSVTAVGSGGALGKGFLQGTQSHYRYLPEQSTDFIFSILAEETGFIGALLVFALFSIIIVRSLYIARTSQDRFGTYVAGGIAALIGFHVIQNVGMAIGVMPITGIPLFFLSYGGSSLWTALMSMGLLLSIHYRRYRVS